MNRRPPTSVEAQNDEQLARLAEKTSMLKQITINLGTEISESSNYMDSMNSTMQSTDGLLTSTRRRLTALRQSRGLWPLLYLFLCLLIVFVLVKKLF